MPSLWIKMSELADSNLLESAIRQTGLQYKTHIVLEYEESQIDNSVPYFNTLYVKEVKDTEKFFAFLKMFSCSLLINTEDVTVESQLHTAFGERRMRSIPVYVRSSVSRKPSLFSLSSADIAFLQEVFMHRSCGYHLYDVFPHIYVRNNELIWGNNKLPLTAETLFHLFYECNFIINQDRQYLLGSELHTRVKDPGQALLWSRDDLAEVLYRREALIDDIAKLSQEEVLLLPRELKSILNYEEPFVSIKTLYEEVLQWQF